MQERLRKFITQEGLTPSQFADEIGVQRSAISHILSGRNYPSYEFIVKILTRYKNLNPDWLLLGNGSMYRTIKSSFSSDNSPIDSVRSEDQPVYKVMDDESHKVVEKNENDVEDGLVDLSKQIPSKILILYPDQSFEIFDKRK